MSYKQVFDLIFTRLSEPSYTPKGNSDIQKRIDVPDTFVDPKYQNVAATIAEIGANSKVRLTKLDVKDFQPPDIEFAIKNVDRRGPFSPYIPLHRQTASRLIELFIAASTLDQLASLAVYCRDIVNPDLFNYALSIALMHRNDAENLLIPNCAELFPDKFIEGRAFHQLRQELQTAPEGSRIPIAIQPVDTASNVNHEKRVAYFREDLGLNLHYFSFHLIYPCDAPDLAIVAKDRRGEMYYYNHQQILARYNCERLSNHLFRVKPLNDLRAPIAEGYFPKLNTQNTNGTWSPRFDNTVLTDVNRSNERIFVSIDKLERWAERIIDAIDLGYVLGRDDVQIPINNNAGIDCLGNVIQSSLLSPNRKYYGDLSNMGQLLIAYCHDPENKYLEPFGVLGEPATALRDTAFYHWHTFLNRLFRMHKRNLKPYTEKELDYAGLKIQSVEIQFQNKVDGTIKNTLHTFWQESDVELSRGLDFSPKGTVYARLTHLQHYPFVYKIRVQNDAGALKKGTVRIFLAPKCDERNRIFTFEEQRHLMIEMDRFVADFGSGQSLIVRRSEESSVTIEYESTFNPETKRRKYESGISDKSAFCKCGLPQHLLVPKGNASGLPFVLFVMISNYQDDKVDNEGSRGNVKTCNDASSYCGFYHEKYPDARPMGYPFDRPPTEHIVFLNEFLWDNMYVQDVTIKFLNKTVTTVEHGTGAGVKTDTTV